MNRSSYAACLVFCTLTWFALAPRVGAQSATVGGRIVDPTNQIVSGVQVTSLNTDTNTSRVDITDDTGLFRFTNMAPGPYHLTIEKPGFKTIHIDDLVLTVNQVFTFEAHLEIGEVATTTIVKASELPLIELENAQISNVVDSRRITDLPLLTRDPYQLVVLSPGVVVSDSGNEGFSVNGTNERNNNFLLDGVDNNDTYAPGIPGGIVSLNPDTTQEFRVITNNFAPEYGRNNGAVISIITRSGTNDLHGSAYWFGRYSALGARDFFNPAATGPKNPYVRNDFGGSAGGPIKKDRFFWFANYEGQLFVTTLTADSTVPTPEFKTGNFTVLGEPIDVSTPGSINNASGLQLDPTIQKILALYPNPNGPAVIQGLSGTLFFPSTSRQDLDEFTVKLDYNLTKKHTLTGRYTYNRFTDPNPFHTDFLPGDLGAIGTYQRTQAAVVGLTSTLTERLINQFLFGANRTDLQFNCDGVNTFNSFGFVDSYGRGADYGLPFGTPGAFGFGCQSLSDADSQDRYTGTYQTIDNLSYSRGHHLFKWGVEFRDVYENSFNDYGSRGQFNFLGYLNAGVTGLGNLPANSFLLDPSNPATEPTQDAVLTLLGYVYSQTQDQFFTKQGTSVASDERGMRQREWGLFVQDTWKILPNLTATYGLRWEYFGVPFEAHNNLSQLFQDPSGPAPMTATGPAFTFTIVGPGTGHTLYNNQYDNFEPRIGLAWDPLGDGKTSVRAGYGIFHDRVFGNLIGNSRSLPPFQQVFYSSGILSQLSAPTIVPTSNMLPDGSAFFAQLIDPNLKTPYSQNWNFGVQHAITSSLTIEVNYVGVEGTDILRIVDANPPQPALVSQLLNYCSVPNAYGCNTTTLQYGNLWFGQLYGALPSDATYNNAFNNGGGFPGSRLTKSIGRSIYNALQVNVQQRLSHGIQIQGAYTYSHAIDNVNDPLVAGGGLTPDYNFPHNTFDLAAERGNSDFDIRHRGVVNFIYEPDIGRGRGHWNSGFVGRILEGWSLTGIIQAQTGHPFDVLGTTDSNHTGIPARGYLVSPAWGQPPGTDKTFTGPAASALTNTPFDVQPNTGKNMFYGPDLVNVDSAVLKNTMLTEKITLQFRLEAYNLFNHTQFSQPDNLLADKGTPTSPGTFGESLSTLTRPDGTTSARQLQVALKLIF